MAGSDFPDQIKLEIRRKAAFRCSYCRDEMGDHVHHLVPKEEGGEGVFDNGILLCVRCHDMYGHRKDKRLQLRQARDAWYEYVEQRYSTSDVQVFENLATKDDINEIKTKISDIHDTVMKEIDSGRYSRDDAANFASTMVSSLVAHPTIESLRVHDTHAKAIISGPIIKKDQST